MFFGVNHHVGAEQLSHLHGRLIEFPHAHRYFLHLVPGYKGGALANQIVRLGQSDGLPHFAFEQVAINPLFRKQQTQRRLLLFHQFDAIGLGAATRQYSLQTDFPGRRRTFQGQGQELSGMDVGRRILTNLVILAAAVVVTYTIGLLTKTLWGVTV